MKKLKTVYYILEDISEGKEPGFEAIVPILDNGIVFGASIEEIEEGIKFGLKNEKIAYQELVCCKTNYRAVDTKITVDALKT